MFIGILIMVFLFSTGCNNDLSGSTDLVRQPDAKSPEPDANSPEPDARLPVLTTANVSEITQTTALSGGNISSDGGLAITARGVCWNETETPTIDHYKTVDGTGTGSFASTLNNLDPNKTYFVRAYASNSSGTSYGESQSFKTLNVSGTIGSVSDCDGNDYKTIIIGTQVWMAENLRVKHYNNGEDISTTAFGVDIRNFVSYKYYWAGDSAEASSCVEELLMCLQYDIILGPMLGVPDPHKLPFLKWLVKACERKIV